LHHMWEANMRVVGFLFVSILVACGGASEPAAPSATPAATVPDAAVLQKADLADGVEDKVVSKCASCALGMDGDPAHAVQVGDYSMHFCSESCALRMTNEPAAVVETMERAVGGS